MSVNMSGSMSGALAEGMSDGTYKKVTTDRGGVVEGTTQASRAMLDDVYHGIHESQMKVLGDGSIHATSQFIATALADSRRF